MPPSNPRVGVIGLGALGRPIGELLLKAGYRTAVYDVRSEPARWAPPPARRPRRLRSTAT